MNWGAIAGIIVTIAVFAVPVIWLSNQIEEPPQTQSEKPTLPASANPIATDPPKELDTRPAKPEPDWERLEKFRGWLKTPLLDDLRSGRVRHGSSFKAIREKYLPTRSTRYGEFTQATFPGGYRIDLLAHKDWIIYAGLRFSSVTCGTDYIFFAMTKEEAATLDPFAERGVDDPPHVWFFVPHYFRLAFSCKRVPLGR